jgi:hypothetical protein
VAGPRCLTSLRAVKSLLQLPSHVLDPLLLADLLELSDLGLLQLVDGEDLLTDCVGNVCLRLLLRILGVAAIIVLELVAVVDEAKGVLLDLFNGLRKHFMLYSGCLDFGNLLRGLFFAAGAAFQLLDFLEQFEFKLWPVLG